MRLRWSQSAAGEAFGLERQSVSDISEKVNTFISNIQQQFFQNQKKVDKITDMNDF